MSGNESLIPVRLRLYGELARRAGTREHALWLPDGAELQDLFRQAVQDGLLPPGLVERWAAGEVTRHLLVHDDQQITLPADLARRLTAGDEVLVIPWIVGGDFLLIPGLRQGSESG